MEFVFLTSDFYTDHPAERFPELEHKQDRPYVLVLITVGANRFAIPMRSHISHPYAYMTDKEKRCGVDYTKAVLVTDEARYIEQERKPHIRPNEFDALRGKEYKIKCGMQKYIEVYQKPNKANLHGIKCWCAALRCNTLSSSYKCHFYCTAASREHRASGVLKTQSAAAQGNSCTEALIYFAGNCASKSTNSCGRVRQTKYPAGSR